MNEVQIRAGLYLLLGALLREPPDEKMLARLRDIAPGGADDALSQALAEVQETAAISHPEALEQEYHELFIGITQGELLPYESWYLSGYLHEEPLVRLRADLQRFGIERTPESREPEDHIAAICEALALLVMEEHPKQREFYYRHLAPWGERFFADLGKARAARFYRAVAALGGVFMMLERRYFGL